MSFLSGLKRFGLEVLKIGQYVEFGAQAAQQVQVRVAPQTSTGTDFLSRFIDIVKSVEATGTAASQLLGSTALTGPQKLAGATALIANEMSALHVGGKAIANAELYAKAMAGYAQATVDYLQAFDQGAASVTVKGDTTSLPAAVPATATV